MSSFSSLGVGDDLVACLDRLGIAEPYPVQSATVPDALAGRDVVAQSPTGSGKTLAFAIPLLGQLGRAGRRRPRGLVLVPTRELAAQIADTMRPLAEVVGRRVACVYGGTGYQHQLRALERGVDVLVACPGRLIDLVDRGAVDLSAVEVVVIDEADRMADMGFLPAVERLLDTIERPRQTLLFSATISPAVERLVSRYQRDPARHLLRLPLHDMGSRSHEFWRTTRQQRTAVTARLVASVGSSIVFCRTKHGVDRLARHLEREGLVVAAIHGNRSQAQRDRALMQFRAGRARALVGTDVAARGLHVDGVDCVIHFDPPEDDDTYVHRSGRTGRAGATGRVVTFVTPEDEANATRLERRFGDMSGGSPASDSGDRLHVAERGVDAQAGPTSRHRPDRSERPSRSKRDSGNRKRAPRAGHPVAREERPGAKRTSPRGGAHSVRPPQRAHEPKAGATGTVRWFNSGKGFGFIAQDGGGPDVFVHHSAIEGSGYRSLREGQHVQFETTEGPKGLQAGAVRAA